MTNVNATIGYLGVVETSTEKSPKSGKNPNPSSWTGGLLILNRGGRPIEFQCTLPIQPSRTHAILFGDTLPQHLIAESIAPALLSRLRTSPTIILCDRIETLSIANADDYLLGWANEMDSDLGTNPSKAESATQPSRLVHGQPLAAVSFLGHSLFVQQNRRQAVEETLASLSDLPDAMEPFERIREAIGEAQSQKMQSQKPATVNDPVANQNLKHSQLSSDEKKTKSRFAA